MNRSIDAVPSSEGGRAAFGWPTEIAALRRENRKLRAELLDTRLGLRNALQYVLLVHSLQESEERQAQLPRRPTSALLPRGGARATRSRQTRKHGR